MPKLNEAELDEYPKEQLKELLLDTHERVHWIRQKHTELAMQQFELLERERIRYQALAQTLEEERNAHAAQTGTLLHEVGVVLDAITGPGSDLQSMVGRLGKGQLEWVTIKQRELRVLEGALAEPAKEL